MPEVMVNYLAVIVAALVPMVVGFVWYSPMLFGNLWMKESGMTAADMSAAKKSGMQMTYLIALLGTLVMSYVLEHFVKYLAIDTLGLALSLAFWIWLGFVATTLLDNVLWNKKSWTYYAVGAGYKLVGLILMTIILAIWQ